MAGMKDFKCPNCGGNIEFNSTSQSMKCPYCDSEFDINDLAAYDEEVSSQSGDNMNWDDVPVTKWTEDETTGMSVYGCNSCGGEVVMDDNTGMTSCPYCGNPIVVRGRFAGDLKPDYVIPFKLDKKAAISAFEDHLKGKKLLPRAFVGGNHIEEIKGVYVPFWLFDAQVSADLRYRAVKEKRWSDADYDYVEKRYFTVSRSGNVAFEKVPVDGASKIDDTLMESLEPFDYNDAVPFTTAYLSGFMADRYDVDSETTAERANERIKNTTESDFYRTVTGYNSVNQEHSAISFDEKSVKYALLPVWLLQTNWEGNNYLFAMNGQTGKFVGDLPMDKGAYWKHFIISGLITFVIAFAISMFLR